MKKLLTIFLTALILTFSALSLTVFLGCTNSKNKTANNDNTVATIGMEYFYNRGTNSYALVDIGSASDKEIVIPKSYDDGVNGKHYVTMIEDSAFYSDDVTSIIIPNTVKYIGNYAFENCKSLIRLSVPDSVVYVGIESFKGCDNLTFNKYDGVSYLGNKKNPYVILIKAENSGMTSCDIHRGTKVIYDGAFSGQNELTNLTVPDSIEYICGDAFADCDKLKFAEYDNAYYLGSRTNPYVVAFAAKNKEIQSCVIHSRAKCIYDSAFYECNDLVSVAIPQNITYIGNYAFADCKNLKNMTMPDNVIFIGDGAFGGCGGFTNLILPNSVAVIGERAFWSSEELTSVTIPGNVISLGYEAFAYCDKLSDVAIKEGAIYLNEAFEDCENLKSVNIGAGIIIGSRAFKGCVDLTDLVISSNVEIGIYGFYEAFEGCNGIKNINVPDGGGKYHSVNNCLIETESKTLVLGCEKSVIPDDGTVTAIGDLAFALSNNLSIVNVPDTITFIGSWAFENTAWYNNQPDGAVYINDFFYKYKGDLPEDGNVIIREGTVGIVGEAFSWNLKLKGVTIPNSVTYIGAMAFYHCIELTEITIPEGVVSIGYGAFSQCENLTNIIIPQSVVLLEPAVFDFCSNLKTINYLGTMEQWTAIKINGLGRLTQITQVVCSDGVIMIEN